MIVDIQTQASIPTTGSADVPSSLASGSVTFTNQTGAPVFVPAGTVVASVGTNPARFRTTEDVTVDGGVGQTADTTVEATQDTAGPGGQCRSQPDHQHRRAAVEKCLGAEHRANARRHGPAAGHRHPGGTRRIY